MVHNYPGSENDPDFTSWFLFAVFALAAFFLLVLSE